jgi:transglutaminase superfamily protein
MNRVEYMRECMRKKRGSGPGERAMRKRKIFAFGGLFMIVSAVTFLWTHQVKLDVTAEDEVYISKILTEKVAVDQGNYESELEAIRAIQHAVLSTAPKNRGLAHGRAREPKDLYEERYGLCYDRSRVIEKMLRYMGFDVRHLSIYTLKDGNSPILALSKSGIRSHAVSEVRTTKGWLVVDSNDPWLSLDEKAEPVSIDRVRQDAGNYSISWSTEIIKAMNDIYQSPFTYVYGLYSRHGHFYAPFDFMPDVNWQELSANIKNP